MVIVRATNLGRAVRLLPPSEGGRQYARIAVLAVRERSKTDPRYVKYPRLPVTHCEGYEKR
jgi:hypothetical protein